MDHAVRVQKETSGATPIRGSRAPLIGAMTLCVPLIAFCVYSYVARPEYIWGPPTAPSPVQQEAGLRFGMYLLAQRVESYRAQHGRYPESLAALGDGLEGVSYALVSDSVFELRAMVDEKAIVLRSDAAVDAFLGKTPEFIQGGNR